MKRTAGIHKGTLYGYGKTVARSCIQDQVFSERAAIPRPTQSGRFLEDPRGSFRIGVRYLLWRFGLCTRWCWHL